MNPDPPASPVIDVAAGVIRDRAGRVLVNRRPAGKPLAGQWEFPGGKIDAEESVDQALHRELAEELGIIAGRQRPLIAFSHRYDDRTVRLHVNEVLDYRGQASGREGQALHWAVPGELESMDLLAANTAIVRAIVLPRLCLITDAQRFGVSRTLERLAQHVQAQPVLVIVREKGPDRRSVSQLIQQAGEIVRGGGSKLIVHEDCDFDDYRSLDGRHLPSRALATGPAARPERAPLTGLSCHSSAELQRAVECGADYALLSPVKPTASHPDAAPLGWPAFRSLCEPVPLPVYALGGLVLDDFAVAIRHGAQGVAVLSAAWS